MNPSADLNTSLEKALKERKMEDLLHFSKIQKYWNVIVQEPLSSRTAPVKLEKQTLLVHVEDSAYTFHLKHYEKQILDYIRVVIQSRKVSQIRFRVGPVSQRVESPALNHKTEPTSSVFTTEVPSETTVQCSEKIKNTKTRKRFARWMQKRLNQTKAHDHE